MSFYKPFLGMILLVQCMACGTIFSLTLMEEGKTEPPSRVVDNAGFSNSVIEGLVSDPSEIGPSGRKGDDLSQKEKQPLANVAKKVESATVYVQAPIGWGTGIAIKSEGSQNYILTTYQLINKVVGKEEGDRTVKVVWFSGTTDPMTFFGQVITHSWIKNLAVILVESEGLVLPNFPLSSVEEPEPIYEAMPFMTIGHTFGKGIGMGRNPQVLRRFGRVYEIDFDPSCNPDLIEIQPHFNSLSQGGLVMRRNGDVLGMVGNKNEKSTIVPIPTIAEFLNGTVELKFVSTKHNLVTDRFSVTYEAALVDPFSQIEAWGVLTRYGDAETLDFEEPYRPIGDHIQTFPPRDGLEVTFHLEKGHDLRSALTYQIWIKRKSSDGLAFLKPKTIDLNRKD